MKVVNYDSTRLIVLFIAAGLGKLYLPTGIQTLVDRYKFVAFPRSMEELSADKFSFKHGLFENSVIETLDIFNDGIVVAAREPSDVLDRFVTDLCDWMESAFGLERVETHRISKSYESHLLIQSDAPLLRPIEVLAPIAATIGSSLKSATDLDAQFQPFGLSIAADHALIPGLKPIAFRIERKATAAFDTNLYVTSAPLPTADHVKALEQMEKLLLA